MLNSIYNFNVDSRISKGIIENFFLTLGEGIELLRTFSLRKTGLH